MIALSINPAMVGEVIAEAERYRAGIGRRFVGFQASLFEISPTDNTWCLKVVGQQWENADDYEAPPQRDWVYVWQRDLPLWVA